MAEINKVIQVGNTLTNLIESGTGKSVNYNIVTEYYDGTPMDDSKVDGELYRKKGSQYLRKVYDKEGELFLEKDTISEMRSLTSTEILLIRSGIYIGLKLNGFYQLGDLPNPLIYRIVEEALEDNDLNIINVNSTVFYSELNPVTLEKTNIESLRNLSNIEEHLISKGYYSDVNVLGYYVKGDWGQSVNFSLYEGSRPDDGGAFIYSENLKFTHSYQRDGELTLYHYGAKGGDSSFDDTPFIQNAINYCTSFSEQSPVLVVPPRTFYCLSTHPNYPNHILAIERVVPGGSTDNQTLTIRGAGKNRSSIQGRVEGADSVIYLPKNSSSLVLRDLVIEGGYSTFTSPNYTYTRIVNNGMYSETTSRALFCENVHFKYCVQDGMNVQTWVSTFINCRAEYNLRHGFRIRGLTTSTTFMNCYAMYDNTNIDGSGNQSRFGFYLQRAHYSSLISCAVDRYPCAYRIENAEGFSMIGCGSEGTKQGVWISDSDGVSINGYLFYGTNSGAPAVDTNIFNNVQRMTLSGYAFIGAPNDLPSQSHFNFSGGTSPIVLDDSLRAEYITDSSGTVTDKLFTRSLSGSYVTRVPEIIDVTGRTGHPRAGESGGRRGRLRWNDSTRTFQKYGSPTSNAWVDLVPVMSAQANSTATDVAGIVSNFNSLLAKLRSAGYLAT